MLNTGKSMRNFHWKQLRFLILFVVIFEPEHRPWYVAASKESEVVVSWAQTFGEELWQLGQKMTKSNEIKTKYKVYNARVEHKGKTLIQLIVKNVNRMLSRKIDAVNCILKVAEEESEKFQFDADVAQNFTYYSSKYSTFNGLNLTVGRPHLEDNVPDFVELNADMYREMILNDDTHFYNISVNTSYSSVHVPTNVYDKNREVLETLQWSEKLDNAFRQNYNSDPALSWQYFGSETGIMRHYPAKAWGDQLADVYDCRKRSWYIETATCSKDIVILLDNSGSMTGFRNFVAQLTVKSILDTFSNNDFLNIFTYSEEVQELVPCFADVLIQATPENIDKFNKEVKELKPEGYANVSKAYVKAFELLQKYRDIRRCNESTTGCNQAIMLITDGVPGNTTEIFDKYNWFGSGPGAGNYSKTPPVRIFTYLLGKEVTKVREIQWMACLNRGYYSHIQTLDEVQAEVLKYVQVIATPLVLQGDEHPPTWTHAFTDAADDADLKSEDTRLMIAVGVPAFDRRPNNGTTARARLLGVAATDVPIDDINKLSLPYKLGVNGYTFIVSNNGYVLLHPDLRPVYKGLLKPNYNSIDLTEVEQFDDDNPARKPNAQLLELRNNLVMYKTGEMLNISVKFHYDNMRRAIRERYDYYFAPLPDTPFSLGLAIPSSYGNTWIKVGDEVKKNLNLGINISDYFLGENWKIHPDWVYCKYHYLEGHEFKTPEQELRHFLLKLPDRDWKWSEQYEESKFDKSDEVNCGRKSLSDDAYYCNKELMELLIFDAKVTNESYRTWRFENYAERKLIERYNATLRFVATMSGLTRWQFIFGEVEIDEDEEFGDRHKTALNETWYKSAILQHRIDPNSFVYSVPYIENLPPVGDIVVTASHAIFPRDGGIDAAGSVVGFQFSHQPMWDRFMEITEIVSCNGCLPPCSNELLDCYVIDNNGYIVLAEHPNTTGRFFGEIEGQVLLAMVDLNVFRTLIIYDYQAVCSRDVEEEAAASSLLNPFRLLAGFLEWLLLEVWLITLQAIQKYVLMPTTLLTGGIDPKTMRSFAAGVASPTDQLYDEDYESGTRSSRQVNMDEDELYFNKPKVVTYVKEHNPCDTETTIYVLQQQHFIEGDSEFRLQSEPNFPRPFYFSRIPHSNLLLVVVDPTHQRDPKVVLSQPEPIVYKETEFPCHKLELNDLPIRRLVECFTEHPEEANSTYCGRAVARHINLVTVALTIFLVISHHLY